MRLNRTNERRGVILLVVLSLLTLFAIVGVSFVLYADSEATAARVARESETAQRADMAPEQALALFLGQFIYDVPDDSGAGSGLRGHSLARTMYGFNYPSIGTPGVNVVPFSGVGRLHYPAAPASLGGADDYTLVNYTYFTADGFVRDPERYGTRTAPSAAQGNFYVGGNAPYTYPDLNNFFLAAVNASGQVLTPSFHRPWLFNSGTSFNDMSNPNWTNAQGKYLTLRPRPQDHPGFPGPDDQWGDVKNLIGSPGGNDSIWIDIGAPVMTAPDGTQYKMLVAPLIMDLDGRINLNTAGNILGNTTHVSNQGWGAWEVNLAKVLYGDNATTPVEYMNLFKGLTLAAGNNVPGRYVPGTPPTPTTAGQNAVFNTVPHTYASIDYDGVNQTTPGTPSTRPQPPGFGGTATSCFPTFAQGYLNGGPELTNHPSLFDALRPPLPNALATRVFLASDLEALLRPNSLAGPVDAGSSTLLSDLLRLSPSNFGPTAASSRFRNLITPVSADLGAPGVSPYWYSTGGTPASPYPAAAVNPQLAPVSGSVTFPTLPPTAAVTNNPGGMPANLSEFGGDWRAVSAALGRIRLNQPLPPYPHMGQGLLPPYNYTPLVTWGTAYDTTNAGITTQYQAALNARQTLANQIYRTLLAVTGVNPPTPTTPSSADLIPRRWLAQLAVNIVDYIDEDDISTPFNFYTKQDDPNFTPPAALAAAIQGNDDNAVVATNLPTGANPIYWVFGTELPKVVLNEVMAQAQDATPTAAAGADESVKLWLELFNPMPAAAALMANSQGQDAYRVPMYMVQGTGGYSPYRITITQNLMLTGAMAPLLPDTSANVLGKANVVAPFPQNTLDADFATAATQMDGTTAVAVSTPPVTGAGIDPQGFLLVGPKSPVMPAGKYQDPFVAAGAMNMPPGVPATTPRIQTDSVTYKPLWTATSGTTAPFDERATGLTVLLRRLANPYLPLQADPTLPNYNPYVTIDSIQNVPIRSNATPPTAAAPWPTRGKRQPYAALTQLLPPAMMGTPADPTKVQTFSPVLDQTGTQIVSNVTSTFGNVNAPLPSTASYDWLVHLDRPPISPIELLHVSGFPPYMLTQQFIVPPAVGSTGDNNLAINMFHHYVPWLDNAPAVSTAMAAPWWFDPNPPVAGAGTLAAGQTHRLYRLFEFLECGDRAAGVWGTGRIPGKVNINTIWDPEILRALADANASIGVANDAVIDTISNNLLTSRTPGGTTLGASDRPFLPLSIGLNAAGGQFPNGTSVTTDTLLRLGPGPGMGQSQLLLFQNPTTDGTPPAAAPAPQYWHPYLQTQLLTKLYNNITTRSNTFAVFLTVGFFQVTNAAVSPPTLGPEIGRSEGRQVRHRMFAIVDRTNLNVFSTSYTGPQITVTPASGPQTVQVTFGAMNGPNPFTGAPWSIGVGSTLVFEPGTDNEEVVTLQAGPMSSLQAVFYRSHAPNVQVIQRGNPGPWTAKAYDPRLDPGVVPYFSIID